MQKLPSLSEGLSQSRQFGGAFVLSLHSISQLQSIYDIYNTKTIASLCRNKIFYSVPDNDTAIYCSDNLGSQENEEVKENISYGAHHIRDGINMSKQTINKKLVIPSELMTLPPLHAYLRFAGNYPITRIKFTPKNYSNLNPKFVVKELEEKIGPKKILQESAEENEKEYVLESNLNNKESLDKGSYDLMDD